ncbi:hypothetical protein SAMN00017477_1881 [Peptoniphilus asaccharolyticus DSM 20463]|uniref:Uncharacterized protein n=1 Tax=Peptoniphilus asaccharolyticus DSM 20463 TaxID=573058 RepID=A0A1W1VFN4_PEPAS|nr:hypothetical protein [Peptoniphilus asaccharolyticus]MBL7575893.1 hypothetical protein [Peptoniphilus asaccharolyticus]SMB92030.1 hypothetical protein SAMN00017477_1881 [Peptoniphilus asaccharolyticus DSM 20463]
MIKQFKKVMGINIEKIIGQDRFAFAISDMTDFYDLIEWAKYGGYQGSTIIFYDFETGDVYEPFEKMQNVVYGAPVFVEGMYYFLQGDYNKKTVKLFRCFPNESLEEVVSLEMNEVNLYNLVIIGNPLYIVSSDEEVECYYPKKFKIPKKENESIQFIEDEKLYFNSWIEEGRDDKTNCATSEYKYYEKVIVKNVDGDVISEELGSLYRAPSGDWWIA